MHEAGGTPRCAAPETSDSDAAEATRPEKSSYSYLQARRGGRLHCLCAAKLQLLLLTIPARPDRHAWQWHTSVQRRQHLRAGCSGRH